MAAKPKSLRFGVVLFPGFQPLDAFGPLDAITMLSLAHEVELALLSSTLEPVTTKPPTHPNAVGQSVVPTHTFASAPSLDVLLVPGGIGAEGSSPPVEAAISFIRYTYPSLKYLIAVCTGAGLAARAGVLDGKRATTNKKDFGEIVALGPNVQWVPHARWVTDGNIWTSSGVSAGIDVIFAWMGEVYGEDVAQQIANSLEYDRHTDPDWDPFAELYGLK